MQRQPRRRLYIPEAVWNKQDNLKKATKMQKYNKYKYEKLNICKLTLPSRLINLLFFFK